MNCPHCGRPTVKGCKTCTGSHCQEAQHFAMVARNARKNSPATSSVWLRSATNEALKRLATPMGTTKMPIELLRDEVGSLYCELQAALAARDPLWIEEVQEALVDAQRELKEAEKEV